MNGDRYFIEAEVSMKYLSVDIHRGTSFILTHSLNVIRKL